MPCKAVFLFTQLCLAPKELPFVPKDGLSDHHSSFGDLCKGQCSFRFAESKPALVKLAVEVSAESSKFEKETQGTGTSLRSLAYGLRKYLIIQGNTRLSTGIMRHLDPCHALYI